MSSPERWEVRVGDAERDAVVDDLRAHLGEGRLSLDEFEDRTARALAARIRADLVPLTADLPALRPVRGGPPVRVRPSSTAGSTTWDVAYRIHVGVWAVLAVFFILIWMLTGAGYFWPVWPILGIGVSVGIHAAVRGAVRSSGSS